MNEFRRLNTPVLGISTDSIYSHKIFTQISPSGRKINFPLLSDRSQEVSKKYGILNEKEGFTFRSTFIVDPEGTIQAIFINPPSVGRYIAEIVRVVEALQYNKDTNLAVPANWKSGEPGIARDWNMVGKY
jgi:peroxiredoxin (alkyl hydroperoxide reductase subunit C)